MFHWFFFLFILLEPTYITIDPPACGELSNCTLTEKECVYGFKLDHNGCRTCQCKNSKYTEDCAFFSGPNRVLSKHIMWLNIFFIPIDDIPLATWKKKRTFIPNTPKYVVIWRERGTPLFFLVFRYSLLSSCITGAAPQAVEDTSF